jgi:Raf kinase inhibitor-like YbhB/YbcL family protein
MAILLASTSFEHGQSIPLRHTGDGVNTSPALGWTGPPDHAKSHVLICEDPDAPRGVWVHWVLYDLPPSTLALPEGIPSGPTVPGRGKQGKTDFGTVGYGGPAPPKGKPHRYYFRVYSLDVELDLPPGATRAEVTAAMAGHVLDTGELMGTYGR